MSYLNILKHALLFILITSKVTVLASDKLIDKIVLTIDDKIFTHSQIERIKKNFQSYKAFSPRVYNFAPTTENILKLIKQQYLIKSHLNLIGYVVSDEHIEGQIKQTERMKGISRDFLIKYLNSNGVSYSEYFNVIGQTIEYDLFFSRTITPLISISDQQIKNSFYEKYKNISSLSFNYNLIGFTVDKNQISSQKVKSISPHLKKYLRNKIISPEIKEFNIVNLGDITEEGLATPIVKTLQSTEEGDLSKPVLLGNQYHIFFLKKKDLIESSSFLKEKDKLKDELIEKEAFKVQEVWFKKEISKHHIKVFS